MATRNIFLIIIKTDGLAYLNTNATNLGPRTSAELTLQDICLAVKVLFKMIKNKN